ncbi:hypothetical protein VCHC41A1_2475, partial [Vibrio cholerae HC-41A1]
MSGALVECHGWGA